jgi:hypothetical protein
MAVAEALPTEGDLREQPWSELSPEEVAALHEPVLEYARCRPGLVKDDISRGEELLPVPVFNSEPGNEQPDARLLPPDSSRDGRFQWCTDSLQFVSQRAAKVLNENRNTFIPSNAACMQFECDERKLLHEPRNPRLDAGLVESTLVPWTFPNVLWGARFPLEVFKTESAGWGVRSPVHIPMGAFVCEYTGELKTEQDQLSNRYIFDLDHFRLGPDENTTNEHNRRHGKSPLLTIDAYRKGNVSRWINSSDNEPNGNIVPNPVFTKETGHGSTLLYRNGFFAKKHIQPMEELRFYYLKTDYV